MSIRLPDDPGKCAIELDALNFRGGDMGNGRAVGFPSAVVELEFEMEEVIEDVEVEEVE